MTIGALAFDYDGTIATEGVVADTTLDALGRAKRGGLRLVLVTGRRVPVLRRVFPRFELCDAVVAENGALVWRPGKDEPRALAPAPPAELIEALRRRNIGPLDFGHTIIAIPSSFATQVQAAINESGVDWRIVLNKDSLMCLPPGVDKASGLGPALEMLGLTPAEALGVGDAENDLAFLAACGLAAAVANALPDVKAAADIVTEGEAGDGVAWLVDQLLAGAIGEIRNSPPASPSSPRRLPA